MACSTEGCDSEEMCPKDCGTCVMCCGGNCPGWQGDDVSPEEGGGDAGMDMGGDDMGGGDMEM